MLFSLEKNKLDFQYFSLHYNASYQLPSGKYVPHFRGYWYKGGAVNDYRKENLISVSLSQPHSLPPSPVTILYSEPFDAYLVQLPTVSYKLEMKETRLQLCRNCIK